MSRAWPRRRRRPHQETDAESALAYWLPMEAAAADDSGQKRRKRRSKVKKTNHIDSSGGPQIAFSWEVNSD